MRDLFFMRYVRMYEGMSLIVFARTSVYAHEHIPTATSFFVNPSVPMLSVLHALLYVFIKKRNNVAP